MRHRILRFREAAFEYGEKIGVLGIVEEVTGEGGAKQKVLLPVSHRHLTKELCAAKGWGEKERRSWLDLTEQPSIILTDVHKYLQDVDIVQLPANNPPAIIQFPVDLRQHGHSLRALQSSKIIIDSGEAGSGTQAAAADVNEGNWVELMSPAAKRIHHYSSNSGSNRGAILGVKSEKYQIEVDQASEKIDAQNVPNTVTDESTTPASATGATATGATADSTRGDHGAILEAKVMER